MPHTQCHCELRKTGVCGASVWNVVKSVHGPCRLSRSHGMLHIYLYLLAFLCSDHVDENCRYRGDKESSSLDSDCPSRP